MKRCGIEDNNLVVSILTHPSIYWWVTDDSALPASNLDFTPFLSINNVYVLLPREGCITIYYPRNGTTWEVHSAALPESRGKNMVEAAMDSLVWMFTNTPCRKVNTLVPSFNPLALRLAKQCGMKIEGVDRKSFLKESVLYDQTQLGICKEDMPCQS